ncbi:MAG TPA: O-antigen ligase family protein [Chryseolinea sp.]|nr:O-antigen ligase family protein [Chryseolinea sp.]
MKISLRKVGLLFILLENLYLPLKLGFDFRLTYVLYFLFIAAYPFFYRRVQINTTVLQVLLVCVVALLGASFFGGGGIVDGIRQLILIGFNMLFAYLLVSAYGYDVRELFKDYTDLIFVASIVGIIQLVSQIAGFKYGADYSYLGFDMQNFDMQLWVAQSWFQEPAYLATAFLPVAFAAICRLMGITEIISKGKAITILIVLILSQAATGLIGILLSIAIITARRYSFLRSPVLMVAAIVLIVATSWGFYSIPKIKKRVDDTGKLFFDEHVSASDIESVNASTYAIYSNFRIVRAAFMDSPFYGSGLGTYESIYHTYVHRVMPPNRMTDSLELNMRDANSLFLRLIAETGILGLFLFFLFVALNRIRDVNLKRLANDQLDFWIINSGVYVVIIVRFIRLGHYTMLGFVLMLIIYYLSKRAYIQSRRNAIVPTVA